MTFVQIYAFYLLPVLLATGGWLYAFRARRALENKHRPVG